MERKGGIRNQGEQEVTQSRTRLRTHSVWCWAVAPEWGWEGRRGPRGGPRRTVPGWGLMQVQPGVRSSVSSGGEGPAAAGSAWAPGANTPARCGSHLFQTAWPVSCGHGSRKPFVRSAITFVGQEPHPSSLRGATTFAPPPPAHRPRHPLLGKQSPGPASC